MNKDDFVIIEARPDELKTCPFCGSDAAFEHDRTGIRPLWRVYCRDDAKAESDCPIGFTNTLGYARRVEAAFAWNRREEKTA